MEAEELVERESIEAPAKRWRNRYRVVNIRIRYTSGIVRQPGEEYDGTRTWPSKDTAETAALKHLDGAFFSGEPRRTRLQYLGAFPVEKS